MLNQCSFYSKVKIAYWAVVVAQLVEQSLPILEVCGSNPVISKIHLFLLNISLLSTVYWKDENKEKEAGDGPFKKTLQLVTGPVGSCSCSKVLSLYYVPKSSLTLVTICYILAAKNLPKCILYCSVVRTALTLHKAQYLPQEFARVSSILAQRSSPLG